MSNWPAAQSFEGESDRNIYEDQAVEKTFDELSDLMEQLVMHLIATSLRNIINTQQAYQNLAESKPTQPNKMEPL